MMSYNTIYSQAQQLTGDSSSNTLTNLQNFINQTQHTLLALRKDYTETSTTATTSAATQAYNLPYNYGKMFEVTITVNSIAYPLKPIEDDDLWRLINARSASFKSDIPSFYYLFNDQINIYPTPSSAGNTITMFYHKAVKDMTAADYVTGNVLTLTNGATTVTGDTTPTVWTAQMVGRFLRVTQDGYWYEISAFTSTTSLTLKKTFQGTSITTAKAYTIGEIPTIPEPYHEMLVWRPTALYWMQRGDLNRANLYWMIYDGGYEMGKRSTPGGMLKRFLEDRGHKSESAIISPASAHLRRNMEITDPNRFPTGLTS